MKKRALKLVFDLKPHLSIKEVCMIIGRFVKLIAVFYTLKKGNKAYIGKKNRPKLLINNMISWCVPFYSFILIKASKFKEEI